MDRFQCGCDRIAVGPRAGRTAIAHDGKHELRIRWFRANSYGCLSMDTIQGRLPGAMSLSRLVFIDLLAQWSRWRISHGTRAWKLLSGLLLGVNVFAVCRWGNEPFVCCRHNSICSNRKSDTSGACNWSRRICATGIDGCRLAGRELIDYLERALSKSRIVKGVFLLICSIKV